jgi:hypothetical protein
MSFLLFLCILTVFCSIYEEVTVMVDSDTSPSCEVKMKWISIIRGPCLRGFLTKRAPFRCHILGYTTLKKGLVHKHPTVQIIVYFVKPNGSMRWYAWVVPNYPFILRKIKRCMRWYA